MSFWERNTIILTAASLLGGTCYAVMVILQSMALGAVAPPDPFTIVSYIVLQLFLSVGGIAISASVSGRNRELAGIKGGLDERDARVKTRSEAASSHIFAGMSALALFGWFFHHNGALLFHTVLGGLIVGEIGRGLTQLTHYRRGF